MTVAARWIDAGRLAPARLHATYAGLAASQAAHGPPIVLWSSAPAHVSLGPAQDRDAWLVPDPGVPVVRRAIGGGAVWIDEHQACYALIVPAATLDGRPARRYAWTLRPAVRTLRAFGLPAGYCGNDLWVRGRKIAGSGAATIGACLVVGSSFLFRFPAERFACALLMPSRRAKAWLREGLSLAMTDWESEGTVPPLAEVAGTFRRTLETDLGWRLRPCGVRPAEAEAIAAAEREAVLDEDGWLRSRPPGARHGAEIKLNARSALRVVARGGGRRGTLELRVDGRTMRRGTVVDADD